MKKICGIVLYNITKMAGRFHPKSSSVQWSMSFNGRFKSGHKIMPFTEQLT